MARLTPGGCPRGRACEPLHRIESDEGKSYVCCGLVDRPVDPYRMCFVTPTTDSMYDHDVLDLLDMVEVIVRGMSTHRRLAVKR